MDVEQGPSSLYQDDLLSLSDVFKTFYFLGLSSVYLWDDIIRKIKINIMNIDVIEVLNLYIKLIVKRLKLL